MRLNRDKVSWGLRRCVILAPHHPVSTPDPCSLSLAALGVNWENMIRLGTGNTLRRKWILQRIHFSLGWVWTSNLSVALLILTSQSLCPFWTLIYSIIPLYMTAVSLIGMWEDLFCYVRYFISNFSVLSSWRNCYEDVQLENLSRLWLSDASDQDPELCGRYLVFQAV